MSKLSSGNLKEIKKFVNDFDKRIQGYLEEIKNYSRILSEVDKEIQDVLHFLENDLDDKQILDLGKKLSELRKNRREIKNILQYLNPLVEGLEMTKKSIKKTNEKSKKKKIYNIKTKNGNEIVEEIKIVSNIEIKKKNV